MATMRLNNFFFTLPLILASSLVSAQNGDGGGASGNIPAGPNGGSIAGAQGQSTASVTLSTGAIVAIVVVVVIVIFGGIFTATLFFIAKKRQWTIRETLRHSRRKVATGLKTVMSPLTPARMTFSPGPFKTKFNDKETRGMRGPTPLRKGQTNSGIGLVDVDLDTARLNTSRNRDLEKAEGSTVVVGEKKSHRPQKPSVTIPITGRKMQEPQTPMFNKFFGRD